MAIKLAHRGREGAEARLRREAVVLRTIGPPHVPRLHATGQLADGGFYVVMELISWPTLAERLGDRPGWSPAGVLPVARGIFTAVDAAHAHGLVHRDLKAENIHVADGRVKLLDFGVAKRVAGVGVTVGLTETGQIVGTPYAMAPEQVTGDAIDARTDVYALGILLYLMLTGELPFSGAPLEVMNAHVETPLPRPSAKAPISPRVEAVVRRCAEKDPARRFQSAGEVAAALRDALHTDPSAPAGQLRSALGLYVRVAADGEAHDAAADVILDAEDALRELGFQLPLVATAELLAVRLDGDDDPAAVAADLRGRLGGGVLVRACRGDVVVGPRAEVTGGPLLDVAAWPATC